MAPHDTGACVTLLSMWSWALLACQNSAWPSGSVGVRCLTSTDDAFSYGGLDWTALSDLRSNTSCCGMGWLSMHKLSMYIHSIEHVSAPYFCVPIARSENQWLGITRSFSGDTRAYLVIYLLRCLCGFIYIVNFAAHYQAYKYATSVRMTLFSQAARRYPYLTMYSQRCWEDLIRLYVNRQSYRYES
jgi:hypothetical protein